VPAILSSLQQRTRTALLVLMLFVLPLQGAAQLVAGLQGQRHVHMGGAHALLSGLGQSLRAVLDHLHAAHDPRFQRSALAWFAGEGPAGSVHEHGGVWHQHAAGGGDVMEVGGTADESAQGGVTLFLAWLPALAALPMPGASGERPDSADLDWRDRVVAPPLAPPRS
jgi:hypothetical protein